MSRIILFVILVINITFVNAEEGKHTIKINSKLNTLLKGDGLELQSLGYEFRINKKNGIGCWVGYDFYTSKLKLDKNWKANSSSSILISFDYYYLKKIMNNSIVYLSPSVFFNPQKKTIDNEKTFNSGFSLSLGYRYILKRLMFDFSVFTNVEFYNQKNETYEFKYRKITPIDSKIAIGYSF